ncbi:MAG: ABC transporter substrate-binding protein, partial [Waterburya sp.]
IRYFYNQRAINSQFKRLTFAFLGVATPSDLIQDPTKTPFNIGIGIELQGFQLAEVEPLIKGLQEKTNDPRSVMEEILRWTGGQPFLTQKLCQLVTQINSEITAGYEQQQIEALVRANIINNWKDGDNPPHLKTIQDRIVEDKKNQINLLESYRQVLEKDAIAADEIEPEIVLRLRLSGLVVQQTGKLKVYNEIYRAIFNAEWSDRQLKAIRPYDSSMRDWYASGCKDRSKLLQGKSLLEALQWKDDKNLSNKDHQYLGVSKESKNGRKSRNILLIVGIAAIAAIASGLWVYETYASCLIKKGIAGEKIGDICFRPLITSGEKRAFLSSTNFHLDWGAEYFKKGEYEQAIKLFKQAIEGDFSDPVPQIYLNNARARLKSQPLKLAVVVPIDYYEGAAKEILKGVADAQTQFNNHGGKNGRLLEIIIANDGNEPLVAEKIAKDLTNQEGILGIIGHHASESSLAAIPIYQKKRLAMVSPSSSSSQLNKLKSDIFFRTVASTKKFAQIYARYIKQNLYLDKIVVFYKPDSTYSQSLMKDFQDAFAKLGGKVIDDISLSEGLDIKKEINNAIKQNVKAAFSISNVQTNSVTIAIAKINARLPS